MTTFDPNRQAFGGYEGKAARDAKQDSKQQPKEITQSIVADVKPT